MKKIDDTSFEAMLDIIIEIRALLLGYEEEELGQVFLKADSAFKKLEPSDQDKIVALVTRAYPEVAFDQTFSRVFKKSN